MKIIVGSKNPTKINAAKKVFSHFFEDVTVVGISTDSGVSDMPMSLQETRRGAITRARSALEKDADYGVGIEGGIEDREDGMYLFGLACVMHCTGYRCSTAEGFMLPEIIASRIREGEELGPVMDDLFDDHDIKKKQGAIGIFSHGLISRTKALEHAVTLALIPFVNPKHYA